MHLRGVAAVDDLLDLAPVDAEVAGDRPLAVARAVPGSYRLFQGRSRRWRILARRGHRQAKRGAGADPMTGSDQQHEKFEGADHRRGGSGADQGTDQAMAHAVRQVGADRGHNASTQAPRGQPRYPLVPPAGVQHHHGRGRIRPSTVNGGRRGTRSPPARRRSAP